MEHGATAQTGFRPALRGVGDRAYYIDLTANNPVATEVAGSFVGNGQPVYMTASPDGTRILLPLVNVNLVEVIDSGLRTVTFQPNGGTGNIGPQSSFDDTTLTPNTFTRTGCTFTGWSTSPGISPVAYANNANYPFDDDTTLYAQWNVRTVTFNPNGGTGSMSTQSNCSSTALSANTFTRTGYTFTGWNTAPLGGGTPYTNQAAYPFTADDALYAQWQPIPPPPVFPPSPPEAVAAVASDAAATITCTAPTSEGTFPVTSYQAVVSPGGQACLVNAPSLTCTVTGLTNGTTYTATVRALNGAGWSADSPPSTPFTPAAPPSPPAPSITITGTRSDVNGRPGVLVSGISMNLDPRTVLRPWLRFPGEAAYSEGAARITIAEDGSFTWQRRTSKRVSVIVRTEDGTVASKRVVIRPT